MNQHNKIDPAAIETPEFLQKLLKGDETAFKTLVRTLQNKIYSLALRIVRNPEEAEEILQETFLSVFDKIHTFQGKSKLSTWVYSIASNAALTRIRKKNAASTVTFEEENALNIESALLRNTGETFHLPSEDPLILEETRERLETAIDRLPEGYRELFILKEIEKLPIKDIAQILNLNEGVVKTRLHRARLHLRALLSDYWNEGKK